MFRDPKTISSNDLQLAKMAHQVDTLCGVLHEVRLDVKYLMGEADRARERTEIYGRWVKAGPVVFALVSAFYWILLHAK